MWRSRVSVVRTVIISASAVSSRAMAVMPMPTAAMSVPYICWVMVRMVCVLAMAEMCAAWVVLSVFMMLSVLCSSQ